jgi:hypothetical protein
MYLEEVHNAVIEPISHLDVIALSRRERIKEAITHLLSRAAEISPLDPDGSTRRRGDWYQQDFKLASSWGARLGGDVQLRASPEDPWAFPRVDEPAFGIGFSLPRRYHEPLRDSSNLEWLTGVEKVGFSVARHGDRTLVFRTLYVAELISKGATTDAQADFLAEWVDDGIARLQEHDPGI